MLRLPSPVRFTVWWGIGSILGVLILVQIITGLFLRIHYTADLENTFSSIVHIIRDAPAGWFMRNVHANGGTLFFFFLYLHVGRGLYYQRYISQPITWLIGVVILFLSMATAFLGYVLPWGQISFWGATVITNLLSAIPYWGPSIVEWLWGGFAVGQPTLNRFFSLHFILPFLIAGTAVLHLIFLHDKGSTSPLGDTPLFNKVSFHPYFTWKDVVGFVFLFILIGWLRFYPNIWLAEPENFIPANSMVTPVHIQPEWYFLFAYAILRSIPSKLGGVLALILSIAILFFLPISYSSRRTPFDLAKQVNIWCLIVTFILLTWLGACPIEEPYLTLAGPITIFYFISVLFLLI